MPGGAIGMRAMTSPPWLLFPSEPVTDRPAHDQLEIAALQPGQLFREQRYARTPRARHARDVGAPEPARGAEGVVEAVQVVANVGGKLSVTWAIRPAPPNAWPRAYKTQP